MILVVIISYLFISLIVAIALWPYVAARFVWRRINAAMIKPMASHWNKPIDFEKVIFRPMSVPMGSHTNLNILRHGFLIAERKRISSSTDEERY